ncbi:hypothetical protein Hdeb2414_s0667g00932781 [Helianthus debilis subsp. tardiflorus]
MNDNDNGIDTGVNSSLLNNFVYGVVDYKGRPVLRSKSGCWRSAYFIIGNIYYYQIYIRSSFQTATHEYVVFITKPLCLHALYSVLISPYSSILNPSCKQPNKPLSAPCSE